MHKENIFVYFKNNNFTLGSVESFTGGLFASDVVSVSGASKFFKGGIVTYATSEKHRLLGISNSVIKKYGVVSKEIAYQMAEKGQKVLDVDCCISFTGNAGPDVMEDKPVGEIYIGISFLNKTEVFLFRLSGTRMDIRNEAVGLAYKLLFEKFLK